MLNNAQGNILHEQLQRRSILAFYREACCYCLEKANQRCLLVVDKAMTAPDPQYSLPARIVLNHVNILRIRIRYYFFWLMAESFNNCAGLGFTGYDERGRAKWNLVSNVDIVEIELATSMRTFVNKWNALTSLWLRR